MNTPRLLNDPDVPAFQRGLLRAWSEERPSSAARERAMAFAALVGVGGAAGGGAAGGAANAGSVGGSLAPKAMSASALVLLKWIGLGSVLVGLVASGAISVQSARIGELAVPRTSVAPPNQAAGSQVPTAQPDTTPVSTPLPAAPLPAAPLALPAAPSARGLAPPPSAARPHSSSTQASTLGEEIASLDRIRTALADGDAPRALQLVDDYERRFPRGAFVQEAEILRIDALVREGDRGAASGAADRFVVAYPASPHLARLRALTGSTTP